MYNEVLLWHDVIDLPVGEDDWRSRSSDERGDGDDGRDDERGVDTRDACVLYL